MTIWDRIRAGEGEPAHDRDFAAWAFDQARRIREARPNGVDIENVADELEDMGKSEYRGFESCVEVILVDLLKWDFQPGLRGASWTNSIDEHRDRIEKDLRQNPSFRRVIPVVVDEVYPIARRVALRETGIAKRLIPTTSPCSWDDVMSREPNLDDPDRL